MNTDPVRAKIADDSLRRFQPVDEHRDGTAGVLIELDVPTTTVAVRRTMCGAITPASAIGIFTNATRAIRSDRTNQRHRPYTAFRPASIGEDEDSLVAELEAWFKDIGLTVRYLRSAHAFSAKVTSEQLRKILPSNRIRSVAANNEVSITE